MKNILTVALIISVQFVFSQNFENIDKIEIFYSVGHTSWGRDGIYSTCEIFELTKVKKGNFKFSRQLKIHEKVKDTVFSKDSTVTKVFGYRIIPKKEMENLLTALNTNKDNFTEEILKQNFKKPTPKEIFKIAQKCQREYYLESSSGDRSFSKKRYSEIQEYNSFDEFLKLNKPKINERLMRMDVWNFLGVRTFNKEETKSYDLQLFKNGGQPVSIGFIEIDDKAKKVKVIENKSSSIINLDVNLILQKIIPSDSKLWNAIDLNQIRDQYIFWYLENKL